MNTQDLSQSTAVAAEEQGDTRNAAVSPAEVASRFWHTFMISQSDSNRNSALSVPSGYQESWVTAARTREPDKLPTRIRHEEQRVSFHPLQEWEGYVTAVGRSTFTARLTDLTRNSRIAEEEAEFPIDDLEDEDRDLLGIGRVFRCVIGYQRSVGGQKMRVSHVVFRRLRWTKEDLAKAEQEGRELAAKIKMGIAHSVGPRPDQVEVTLFGPGYGESAVMHLGNNNWIVVDSCLDSDTAQPAAISYLEGLGVDPSTAVKLVVATHWHDDHIGGMGTLVSRCAQAKFCASSALSKTEFGGYVRKFQPGAMIAGGSGVREIDQVIKLLSSGARVPVGASPNKLVYRLPAEESGHGKECCLWTLSPSEAQFQKFLFEIAALVFEPHQLKHRAIAQKPNHLSVVAWVSIGETAILLGADLEETHPADTGWSVIVGSTERPPGRASVYKVAHHGSANGHNDEVWRTMLLEEPFALLTPWSLGSILPRATDVKRIVALTPNAYSTAKFGRRRLHPRVAAVEKTLKEHGIKLRYAEPPTGGVRLRKDGMADCNSWELELLRRACHLSEFFA